MKQLPTLLLFVTHLMVLAQTQNPGDPPPGGSSPEAPDDDYDEDLPDIGAGLGAYKLYRRFFGVNATYLKQVRSVSAHSSFLVVDIEFKLKSLIDIDEQAQTMQLVSELRVEWRDHFLSWNASKYDYIRDTSVFQDQVWLPDIVVGNSVDPPHQLGYKQLPVRIRDDGRVIWRPTVNSRTSCDIVTTYYPFDTQKCDIEFETETSSNDELQVSLFEPTSDSINIDDYGEDGSWKLIGITATDSDYKNKGGQAKIVFSLLFERRNIYYIVSIIIPVIFLSFTAALVFALPSDCGEKMGFSITVLLSFAVYLEVVSDYLPDTSLQTSILALYLTILLGYTAFAVVIEAFILRLHHRDPARPVGHKVKAVTRILKCLMCGGRPSETEQALPPDYNNEPSPRANPRANWNGEMGKPSGHVMYTGSPRGNHHDRTLPNDAPYSVARDPQSGSRDKYLESPQAPDPPSEEMTWQDVAETLDWFCFIVFSLLDLITTGVCAFLLLYMSGRHGPSLDESSSSSTTVSPDDSGF